MTTTATKKRSTLFSFLSAFGRGFEAYRLKIVALIVLGFASGLLEGIGINAFIPLFSFLSGANGVAGDTVSRLLRGVFAFGHVPFSLRYLFVFITALFILKTVVVIVGNYISILITTDYVQKTRSDLFTVTLSAGWPYLLKQKVGHLDTVIITNLDYCEILLNNLTSLIIVIGSLLMYLLVAVNISPYVTLFTVVIGGLLFWFLKSLLSRARSVARDAESINRETAHHINQSIGGMKSIKASRADEAVVRKGLEYFQKLRGVKLQSALFKYIPPSLMQPVGLIFIICIFAVSYKLPNFNLASLVAVIYLIDRIFLYIQKLQLHLHMINESYPYFEGVVRFKEKALSEREPDPGGKAFSFKRTLEFRDVSFSYDAGRPVLEKINFSIAQGQMVGLIGPSGAGKTTIVDLLLRLFTPTSGSITVDGTDIRDVSLDEWRRHIGYVSQDMYLLNDTIENNIRFYDESLSDDDIRQAAQMAQINDFVESSKDKYQTVIGERGVLLSAGQRQRVIIARVLARKPELLILDEATSALDNESETQIQKVIESLKGKLTVFVIAHRLSTIVSSHTLIALEKGAIAEVGTPEKLLADKESYFFKVYHIRKTKT